MPSKDPAIVMVQGPEPGSVYRLPDNRVTTVGRSSQNTVTVVNPAVSRFHCEIACVNGRWELTDLNSRRGTMVNNEWVGGSAILHFGDIIRMSTVVFRFDQYEQGVDDQGALLAIKEAELDKKLVPKGEAEIGMEDIMMRSRLESKSRVEARRRQHRVSRASKVFLMVVAGLLATGLAATLLWAHGFIPGLGGVKRAAPPANAPAANQPDEHPPRNEPDHDSAEDEPVDEEPAADTRPADEAWQGLEQRLQDVRAARLQADYAAALAALDRSDDGEAELPDEPRQRLEQERRLTLRMARAWHKDRMARASQLAEQGHTARAVATYRETARKVGIPELARQANQHAEKLQTP
jgi:pSer/pThr/pTyr-binding forkhead associated (FHA) protein